MTDDQLAAGIQGSGMASGGKFDSSIVLFMGRLLVPFQSCLTRHTDGEQYSAGRRNALDFARTTRSWRPPRSSMSELFDSPSSLALIIAG